MRERLTAAFILLVLIPMSHAGAQPLDGTLVSSTKSPYAGTPLNGTWEDGSSGHATLIFTIDKPVAGDEIDFLWQGLIRIDGGPLERAFVEWEGSVQNDAGTNVYHQRKMKSAHLLFSVDDEITLLDRAEGDIDGELLIKVRWTGHGPVERSTNTLLDGDVVLREWRRASLTGSFTLGGIVLPGSDFSLGTGALRRERTYTP